jgi:adenylate cyclase class IV
LKEIEIKALLTKEKYSELKSALPKRFKKINEDNITTIKFKPHDVRVRYSEKLREVVFKDTDPTKLSRKEVSINLASIEDCHNMISLLKELGMEQHPSWTTRKDEFVCEVDGNEYTLSLQDIPNFAYILEAEVMSDDPDRHIPNLKKVISSLGCEPIEPEEFKEKINEYIKKYSKR